MKHIATTITIELTIGDVYKLDEIIFNVLVHNQQAKASMLSVEETFILNNLKLIFEKVIGHTRAAK